METLCENCGAELRLNPKLAGTTVSCPQCGSRIVVPKSGPRPKSRPKPEPKLELEPDAAPRRAPAPPRTAVRPYSLWMLGAQAALVALGVSCLAGAFFSGWKPPDTTYFREDVMRLVLAGIALILGAWLTRYAPVLATLGAAVTVIGACAFAYIHSGAIDASRTLALAVAMLALWLALQHRRGVTR